MNTNPIILVVGATRKENIHIEKCLMDWEYEAVPLNEETPGVVAPIPQIAKPNAGLRPGRTKGYNCYLRTASKRPCRSDGSDPAGCRQV